MSSSTVTSTPPSLKGTDTKLPFFISRKQDRTNQDHGRIEIGATTRIKTTVCRKSGAAAHPADHTVPHQWLDGNRGSRLDRQLRHDGWRDLRPYDRTPVNGWLLGGLLQHYGFPLHKTCYLVSGFTEGFRLRLDSSVAAIAQEVSSHSSHSKSNHKSARVNPKAIEDKL